MNALELDAEAAFGDLMRVSVGAAALASLAQLDVLGALCERARTAPELAATFDLDEAALVRALRVAEGLGVLARSDDRWRVAPALRAAAERGPAQLAQIVALARRLPEHLRSGWVLTRSRDDRAQSYRAAAPGLSRMMGPFAAALAERLDRPLGTILDVGAGAGIWSLSMARRRPGCRVTGLDLAPVLGCFLDNAARLEVAHDTVAGDYHRVELEARFDRVLLANVLHLEQPAQARALVQRAAAWVRPGGELVVVDTMVRDAQSALDVAIYELHLALRVAGGQVHAAATIEGWCREAGLEACTLHTVEQARGGAALVAARAS